MTATSELGYIVRGADGEVIANRALDAAACRHLVNNLRHLQDESTQVYANITGHSNGAAALTYWEMEPATLPSRFVDLPAVPVILRKRVADITSQRFEVRVRCYTDGGGSATYFVALRTFDMSGTRTSPVPGTATDASMVTFTESSATAVEHRVEVYANGVNDSYAIPMPTLDQDGNAAEVMVHMAQIEIWATSTAGSARIEALTVREFVG